MQTQKRSSRWIGLACCLLFVAAWPQGGAEAAPVRYAGWAMEAYPEQSGAEMEAMVRRITDAGANVIWIGHNNPGEVDPEKLEPGLSYAVYEAYRNPDDPLNAIAVAVVEAQLRLLAACRAAGVRAVLPVGYQIQMGRTWNARHPADLRRDAEGRALDIYGGGVSASFYAPSYRRDIAAYYRWVEDEFVRPYEDVVLMINLADEPIGGDYSAHAEAELRRERGFGFGDVGDDPGRQRMLGEFESRYIVEYATFSAQLWQEIHPGLPVTMSFDGAQARATYTMPDVEGLFRDTPANFVVTFDAYPHDGLPQMAVSEEEMVGLFLLARSLGLYSARYGKPVWLWAAANSWGLSQASPDPGSISDAVANGLYLALLVRQGGGDLQGIAYWNYNVKRQGLYNDTNTTAYKTEAMFSQVSAALPEIRRLMAAPAGQPSVLILAPADAAYQQIGLTREPIRLEVQPYERLTILARSGVNAAIVGRLSGWSLGQVRTIVVLSSLKGDPGAGDGAILADFVARGGRVVGPPGLEAVLADGLPAASELAFGGLMRRRGTLYTAQQGPELAFEDPQQEQLAPFWEEVLGLDAVQPGYRIVTDRVAFYYQLGPEPVTVRMELPFEAAGQRYDDQGLPTAWIHGPAVTATLGRREYVLLRRLCWYGLWPT